jgi:DNA-binding response OmpR family regulator
MPLLDGFEVLLWLQACPEPMSLPVVLRSSSSLAADKKKAKDLGAKDYLAKPTDLEEKN